MKILKNIKKLNKDSDYSLEVSEILTKDKNRYNIKIIPTLIIDDKVVSSGGVPSDREIRNIIRKLKEA